MLVDDHIARFNKNLDRNYHPSDPICLDESMSRWYGIGGYCINSGLPQYFEIDRNPKNSCEIHNSTDGISGIIILLKLAKTPYEENIHYL